MESQRDFDHGARRTRKTALVPVAPTPSPDEVMAAKGPNGYWPKEQLQAWGIPVDPVPARWREGLERKWHEENIPAAVRGLLLAAGYDEEGVETAWRSYWHGLGRFRMYEAYWKDPEEVLAVLRNATAEVTIVHPEGGEIVMRVPVEAELAARTIDVLATAGWTVR
jgi:hypothetical protein